MNTEQSDNKMLRFKVYHRSEIGGYPMTQNHLDRVEYEMKVIRDMKFAGYFLIVADVCDFMRREGIRFNVRGSGCGSSCVWRTWITHKWLDPIAMKLPFERFLNPSRVSNPDLDIDIDDEKRHRVVEYVVQKYGSDRVARVITFGTMGAKAAVNDIARSMSALGKQGVGGGAFDEANLWQSYRDVAQPITKEIPTVPGIRLEEAINRSPILREEKLKWPTLFRYAEKAQGKSRHTSIHAAATIIAPSPITDYMPLFYKGGDEEEQIPATQWDMYDCEDRGLLKMDFLGLKTLRVIDHCESVINMIRKAKGDDTKFSVDHIPQDDDKTWQLLSEGKLSGIFQLESQYVRGFAQRMNLNQKKQLMQLAVLVSIIRPGMMDAGTTEVYLRRASGIEGSSPLHPLLAKTLEETHGIMVFQEDCMWVSQDMAGFDMAEADNLRRGIGKKKKDVIEQMRSKFIEGCVNSGATEQDAVHVWEQLETFARYGFCRGHAAAYGMVSYQTAYLKAHHPLVYMTMLTNSEAGVGNKEDGYNAKVAEYVQESRMMGIDVVQPCVKSSGAMCRVELDAHMNPASIRFGLLLVKGVSHGSVQWILDVAGRAATFKDFVLNCFDQQPVDDEQQRLMVSRWWDNKSAKGRASVLKKTGVQDAVSESEWEALGDDVQVALLGQKQREVRSYSRVSEAHVLSLIQAGALDIYGMDRDLMAKMLPEMMKLAKKYHEQSARHRSGVAVRLKPDEILERVRALQFSDHQYTESTLEERLAMEREVTGCYLSDDPFSAFGRVRRESCDCDASGLIAGINGQRVLGILTSYREIVIKKEGRNKGRPMAFLNFQGVGADFEVTVFPDIWEGLKERDPMERSKVYWLRLDSDFNRPDWILKEVTRLSDRNYANV